MVLRRCIAALLTVTTLLLCLPAAARAQGAPPAAAPPQPAAPQPGAPPPPGYAYPPPGYAPYPQQPYGPPPGYAPGYGYPPGYGGVPGYTLNPAEQLYRSGRRMQIAGIALTITGATLGILAGVLLGTRARSTTNEYADTTINVFKEVFGYFLVVGGILTFVPGVILWPVGALRQQEARNMGFRGYAEALEPGGPRVAPSSATAGFSLRLTF